MDPHSHLSPPLWCFLHRAQVCFMGKQVPGEARWGKAGRDGAENQAVAYPSLARTAHSRLFSLSSCLLVVLQMLCHMAVVNAAGIHWEGMKSSWKIGKKFQGCSFLLLLWSKMQLKIFNRIGQKTLWWVGFYYFFLPGKVFNTNVKATKQTFSDTHLQLKFGNAAAERHGNCIAVHLAGGTGVPPIH